MSKQEKRWIYFGFGFLFFVILTLFTITNVRISSASERINQKADIKYVNYTVLSKYDSIMLLLNDIKISVQSDTLSYDKDRGRNKTDKGRVRK